MQFLAGPDRAATVAAASRQLRTSFYAGDLAEARKARDAVQAELRRVMVRTERLASTPDRDGMIVRKELTGADVVAQDLRNYASDHAVAELVKAHDVLEYWRSAPYLFEFMDAYKVKRNLETAVEEATPALAEALDLAGTRLAWDQLRGYQPLDPGNAKMRGLVSDVLDRGAWRLAWIPPSLPYYELSGAYADPDVRAFTKRLVFSSWTVVPKAIASLMSYETERRLMERGAEASDAATRRYDAQRQTALLTFQESQGRLTGMPVLGLLYPSTALAEAGDPVVMARRLGATFPLERAAYVQTVRERVAELLLSLPPGAAEGRADDQWFWAVPILLDRLRYVPQPVDGLSFGYDDSVDDDGANSAFDLHIERARRIEPADLGRRPDDLVDVMTQLAVAGPGVTATRAFAHLPSIHRWTGDDGTR